jgi:hypothetical protein
MLQQGRVVHRELARHGDNKLRGAEAHDLHSGAQHSQLAHSAHDVLPAAKLASGQGN